MAGTLVTLVFTDLVNSTAIKPLLPGADMEARNKCYLDTILEPHRARVTAALAEHGGRVVKTEGDAFFVVFPSAARAAAWAIDVERCHRDAPIETPLGPLRVKIGMHSGAPLVDSANAADFVGSEVDCAARVAGVARGSQILVSEVTAALLRAEGTPAIELFSVGEVELKGIGSMPLFELLHDGKAPEPLEQAGYANSNLPPVPDGFTGRAQLLAEIQKRIGAGGVTILKGEGGIGKTALAICAAHHAIEAGELPGGVAWINCELKPSLDECLRQMAKAFFGDRMEREPIERCRGRVAEQMNRGGALLVMDNFETIAKDVAILRGLSRVRPPVRVLVTTREVPRGLAGGVVEVRELEHGEAMELFRAQAAAGGVVLAAEDDQVSELCAALGEQPLAIRLLAARAARIPLPRLLERVRCDLEVLKTQDPTVPAQHQSARACFELSFANLGEAARALLLRLSVLPDGAGPAVIKAILCQDNWDDAAEELVAASVWRLYCVRQDVHPELRQRYTMHPLVRQFALEELGPARAEAELRAALAIAELVKANVSRAGFGAADLAGITRALDWCDVERQTLLACASFAFQAGQWDAVFQIAATIFNFWKVRGYWADAERLYEQALEATRRAGSRPAEAQILNCLGNLSRLRGRLPCTEEYHSSALALWRSLGDRRGEGNTLKLLARVYQLQGRHAESEQACHQALAILREVGDRMGEAKTLVLLGNAYRFQERWEEAERQYSAAWELSHQIGDLYDEGDALNYLGHVHCRARRWEQSEASFQQSLAIWLLFRDRRRQGITLYHWACLCQARGQAAEALQRALHASEVLEATDDRAALENAHQLVAELSKTLAAAQP
jgi:class 3 adenylate cyclase/tetratricopeptide (TPR) repeat protein